MRITAAQERVKELQAQKALTEGERIELEMLLRHKWASPLVVTG